MKNGTDYVSVAIVVATLALVAFGMLGCGDGEESLESSVVLAEGTEIGVFAAEKYSGDAVAAAPQKPGAGTPSVKEIGFYSDWKLTKPIAEPVAVGKTVFIKVVFSEPMQHVVSDGKESRPVLFYKSGKDKQMRFRMAAHGARSKDFVSGDAKPLGNGTDDYVCKYKVVSGDVGKDIAFMVGKWSVDLQGNPLAAFYRHEVKLQVERPNAHEVEVDPVPSPFQHPNLIEEPSIPKYFWADGTTVIGEYFPTSAWVLDFPGPYRAYAPPRHSHRDFVGRVAMPVRGADADAWEREGYVAPVSGVVVTITQGTRAGEWTLTDEGGYFLFKDVVGDELYLRVEQAYLEPKEVIVSRSRGTKLQRIGANRVFIAHHHEAERTPGTILMGLRWPDAVRFILENETLPHDVLCIRATIASADFAVATYSFDGLITLYYAPGEEDDINYGTLSHELAHARQQAIAGSFITRDWENTPEAKAYRQAVERDQKEAPEAFYYIDTSDRLASDLLENAAEFCSFYWDVKTTGADFYDDGDPLWSLKTRAPNRFKWAEKYLNTKY